MKQRIKQLLMVATLGLWASTAPAHHILGNVVCTDTPATLLGGVRVTIQGATTGTLTTTTRFDGFFYQALPAVTDTYTVTITPPSGLAIVSPPSGQYVVTLFAGGIGGPQDFEGANFNLTGCTQTPPQLGRIGDTVYCDTNANGVQDAGELGIAGVKVVLLCKNALGSTVASATNTTDANGKYLFTDIPPGICEVSVDTSTVPGDCSMPVCAVKVTHTLSAGEIYLGADFCFTPPTQQLGRIGDTVYCDANGNGVQDSGEAGIPGVTVVLLCKNAAGATIASTTAVTDVNGKYLFINVPAGICVISVDVSTITSDCNDPVCDTTITHVLAAGETYLGADFCFTEPQSGPGTGTPGYWKNHPEAWPVSSITIGGRTYSRSAAIRLIGSAEKGDKTKTVFRHLVSAKLNVMIGNASGCIADAISAADAWMALHPVGSRVSGTSAAWAEISGIATMLDAYNNGLLCAPHRD